jgi:hypothetical protein
MPGPLLAFREALVCAAARDRSVKLDSHETGDGQRGAIPGHGPDHVQGARIIRFAAS